MRRRLFFALWPSQEEQRLFWSTAQDPRLNFSARFLAPETLHLTLAFLPSVEEEQTEVLISLVERPLLPMILLRLDRLLFQPSGKEGLLWLTAADFCPCLAYLVESLQKRLIRFGLLAKEERPFSPHITLARRVVLPRRPEKGRRQPVVLRGLAQPIDWRVREMALVSSETLPEGSRYTRLASWALPTPA
ncbi:MAG: RNA 2',3'-cyclic phosphodiesterase [Methylacidiphilaceae bacterium]|nr:RNA 2',3'-cyclic phosphodiesterase [Candidatus Methylacidiphilaceae bacterium]